MRYALIFIMLTTAAFADRIITVKRGETLTKIAKKYLDDPKRWRELLKYNKIANPNLIYPGRKLKLPDFLAKKPQAQVIFKTGSVMIKERKKLKWKRAKIRQGLYARDALKTGKRSKAKLALKNKSRITINPKTYLLISKRLSKKSAGTSLLLKKGSLHAFVRGAKRSGFRVQSPTAVAGVRGTDFFMMVDENDATRLGCLEGEVAVSAEGQTVAVKEGQATMVKKGEPPQQPFALLPPPTPEQ